MGQKLSPRAMPVNLIGVDKAEIWDPFCPSSLNSQERCRQAGHQAFPRDHLKTAMHAFHLLSQAQVGESLMLHRGLW